MKSTAIFDAAGQIINIGPWDYVYEDGAPIIARGGEEISAFVARGGEVKAWRHQPNPRRPDRFIQVPVRAEPGESCPARQAKAGETIGYEQVVTNPMPAGAYEREIEVVEGADGGLHHADEYAELRRAAYPSVEDQLDAFWKGGAAADEMRGRVLAVKAAHPKPVGQP